MAGGGLFMIHITAITTHNEILDNIPYHVQNNRTSHGTGLIFSALRCMKPSCCGIIFTFIRLRSRIAFSTCSGRKSTIMTATVLCAPRLEPGHTGNGRGGHFQSDRFIVSFHLHESPGVSRVRERFSLPGISQKGRGTSLI